MTQSAATICWALGLVIWFIIRYPHQRRARKHAIVDSRDRASQQSLVAISVVGVGLVPAIWALTG
ncbi:MAG: isoprenylcysteine carboxylmethyltransferase family protein, partial [Rhizobiales bacterium]|nr:isoprenylcysteine carboxylmethyltransferase family protein [Hyphomicrobiales bacterium]